jgi:hypothetical protein
LSTTLWVSAGLKVFATKSAKVAKEELKNLQLETIKEAGCIFLMSCSIEIPSIFLPFGKNGLMRMP